MKDYGLRRNTGGGRIQRLYMYIQRARLREKGEKRKGEFPAS
jgi:hypothetical protein